MVDRCQEERFVLPTEDQRSLSWLYSKTSKGAEPVLRRLITLIFAGCWLPHDLVSSRSCLGLVSGVRPEGLSNSVVEGSPNRGCAPVVALENCVV